MLRCILVLLSILFALLSHAQQLDRAQGELIVQFHPKAENIPAIINQWDHFKGRKTNIKPKRCLSESMNIWQLKFDFTKIHENRFLQIIRTNRLVQNAQFNHLVSLRKRPNDPSFIQQWQYINDGANGGNTEADLDIDLAWDITTGGVTPNGDTIVIVALDNGVDVTHEDFGNNLWRNHQEIPDNGIDDDNNGYIDDINGWNAKTNSGRITSGNHGTPVMGIMGAKGNNEIGVSGVNWDVKLIMVQTDFEADEATLLTGYGYPLALRKLYNETNGEKGAFVVATNASWGIDNGMPEDAPVWCALYDSLGAVGILNCGATANENINVDVDGDLPTTCPSDFLIGVTNLNRAGEKMLFAGYGREHIDLGAFGEDVYTLARGSRYEPFGGTSGATPHVTGAIGLLYSAPCNNFGDLMKNNPAGAALLVRQYILGGVKPNESLDTITSTGGQLNINNSLQLLLNDCGPCPQPLAISIGELIDVSAKLNWESSDAETAASIRYRRTGTSSWTIINNVVAPYILSNLTACTNYEFELKSDCADESSGYTRTYTFKTDGCCIPPENIQITNLENSGIRLTWDPLFAAQLFEIRINEVGAGNPMVLTTTDPFYDFPDLPSCTSYEYQIRTICQNQTTDYSPLQFFTTRGCGSCTDVEYCISSGDEDFEWISRVILNDLDHESGSETGYGDYTDFSTDLNTLETYEMTVEITYQTFPFIENVQAWIDFNQDGQFDEITENIINSTEDIKEKLTTNITIPIDAKPGLTRMRVGIKWREGNDKSIALPCSIFDFGEVEDYCVNIIQTLLPCFVPDSFALLASPIIDTAYVGWKAAIGALNYNYRYRIIGTQEWQTGETEQFSNVKLANLKRCQTYELQAQSSCDSMMMSDFSESFSFNTACDCLAPNSIELIDSTTSSLTLRWAPTEASDKYEVNLRKMGDIGSLRLVVTNNQTTVTSLDDCAQYEVTVRAFCLDTDGLFSDTLLAQTGCVSSNNHLPINIEELNIYPNPFYENINLDINLNSSTILTTNLYNVEGKLVKQKAFGRLPSGQRNLPLTFENLIDGVYFLSIMTDQGSTFRRVVKL